MNKKTYRIPALMLLMLMGMMLFSSTAYAGQASVKVALPVSVISIGASPAEEFRFRLTPLDNAPMPEAGQTYCDISRSGEGEASFPEISFRNVGIYNYTISQIAGSDPNAHYDGSVYDVTVSVTNSDDYSGFIAAVVIKCAGEKYDTARFVVEYRTLTEKGSVIVRKVWDDYGKNRPEFISVQLMSEGQIIDTAVLSEQSGWTYSFEGLVANEKSWYVQENPVPYRYTVSYSYSDNTAVIKNTLTTGLIQTGQLIWPVWVFGGVGVLLGITGLVGLKRRRNDE